jgi:MHS family proline/betaine transporter-like MFS transporter
MNLRKIILPIIIGNMFEWYDFSLYGYMAPIITKLFFPNIDKSLGLITTFSIFLTGFIARPIGSMVLGFYADKYGRKSTLTISILLMAFSTSFIGLLPTYLNIGILASLLLMICRLIQGFAIGGEFTISLTYLIEHANNNNKALYGSCAMLGTFIGLFLGSISIALLNMIFLEHSITAYAWRIPFILSILLGVLGIIMRKKLPETPEFNEIFKRKLTIKNPLKFIITKSYVDLLLAIIIVCLGACNFSLWFVWLPSYLKLYANLSHGIILLINSCNLLVIILIIPLVGKLTDKFGIKLILSTAAIASMLFVLPLLHLMNNLSISSIYLSQLGLAILAGIAYGVVPIALFKLFPTNIRCSGISLSYNIANIIFGGSIPLLASIILNKTSNLIYQGSFIIIASLLMLLIIPNIIKKYNDN